jgi:hypothetical protein
VLLGLDELGDVVEFGAVGVVGEVDDDGELDFTEFRVLGD